MVPILKTKWDPIAKISKPLLSGVYSRKKLFRKLDRARTRPIIWVSGPAGSGKTTLVVSYLEEMNQPCLWYQVDERDSDIATFFYYLGMAGKRASPRKRKPLPLFTPEYLFGITGFTHHFFENIFGRLSSPHVLVFDNYQELSPDSLLHDVFVTGLSSVPSGINVIIVSRSEPPPRFARMLASNVVEVVGWDDLRLSLEEAKGIIGLRGKKKQTKTYMKELHEKSGGWVGGLVLMMEREDFGAVETNGITEKTPETLIDYFGAEVFDRIEASVKDFLLKTAFLPSVTPKVAEKLTGERQAERILGYLNRNNYFTTRHSHDNPSYQYHPLFREFLLSRVQDTFSSGEISRLQNSAASLLEESGEIEDAADLYSETVNWEKLIPLILREAQTLITQGRNHVLMGWLGSIPEDILQKDPWLLFWLGSCRMPHDTLESRKHLERSFHLFFKGEDPVGTFLSWSLVIDTFFMFMDDFKPLDEWIATFDEITKRYPTFPSPDIEARAIASMLGALYMRQMDKPDVDVWFRKAFSIIGKCKDMHVRLQGSLYLFLYFLWIGDFPQARVIVEAIRQLAASSISYPRMRILFHLFEATYYWRVAEFDNSLQSVARGLELGRSMGIHIWDFPFMAAGICASHGMGDLKSASEYFQNMSPVLNTDQIFYNSQFHHLSSWHAALKGDFPLALSHEAEGTKLIIDVGSPCGEALANLFMARLENEMGKAEEAERHLEGAKHIAKGMKNPLVKYQCQLVEAGIAFTRGDEKSGLDSLKKALSLGREKGFFNYDNWFPVFMTRLCLKALEEDIEVDYVQELIRKRGLLPDSPQLHVENWPWEFRIFTIGGFGLEKHGKRVTFSGKVQQRPLLFLKALIALGGRGVARERITDILWPDADADVASRSFDTTLYRLRRLLGNDDAIWLRKERVSLNPNRCWVDVWDFERFVEEVDEALREGSQGDNVDHPVNLSEKAIAIYSGPFLPMDDDKHWTATLRERLLSKFLRCVENLGGHFEETGQWKKALHCYKRGLEVDDLAEEFHRRLMACYHKLGRRAEALATYRKCRETLADVLGVEPSPKTQEIYRSLVPE